MYNDPYGREIPLIIQNTRYSYRQIQPWDIRRGVNAEDWVWTVDKEILMIMNYETKILLNGLVSNQLYQVKISDANGLIGFLATGTFPICLYELKPRIPYTIEIKSLEHYQIEFGSFTFALSGVVIENKPEIVG
jgi:hypothetical protein